MCMPTRDVMREEIEAPVIDLVDYIMEEDYDYIRDIVRQEVEEGIENDYLIRNNDYI